jgi:hypothetical protein
MRSSIAGHPWQKEIDAAILSGQSKRAIAKRFGLSSTAVQRRKHQLTLSNPPEPILVLPPQHSQSAAISQYPVSADPHPHPRPNLPLPFPHLRLRDLARLCRQPIQHPGPIHPDHSTGRGGSE